MDKIESFREARDTQEMLLSRFSVVTFTFTFASEFQFQIQLQLQFEEDSSK